MFQPQSNVPYKENYPVSRRSGQTTPACDAEGKKAAQSKRHKEKIE